MTSVIEPTQCQLQKLVSDHLPEAAKGSGIPVGVAIGYVGPGFQNIFYSGQVSYNSNDSDYEYPPLDGNTRFAIASLTKTFTATLYAYFVVGNPGTPLLKDIGAGSIPLDATLGNYFPLPAPYPVPKQYPFISPYFARIPLTSLANYTSGLPQDIQDQTRVWPEPLPKPYTSEEMYAYLLRNPFPLGFPNTTYTYSNLGFALLADAIGLSQEKPYTELLKSSICSALELGDTEFLPADGSRPEDLPIGYSYPDQSSKYPDQSSKPKPVEETWRYLPAWTGAGGLYTTPSDMLKWLKFNMGLRNDDSNLLEKSKLTSLLAATQNQSTWVQANAPYDRKFKSRLGLGWFISKFGNAQDDIQVVWKDGLIPGFTANISFTQSSNPGKDPSGAGLFVLTNIDSQGHNAIARHLIQIMTGLETLKC